MTTMKRVLITGVHKGLGLGLARTYLANGWSVWGISRNSPESIMGHPDFHFSERNLLSLDDLDVYAHELSEKATGFDMVYLNAGMLGSIQLFEKTTYPEIRNIMDLNVWANKMLLDGLLRSTPPPRQVIAISSGAAKNGSCGWGPYSVSKAALDMLIKVVSNENPGVHMCALAPGLVGTDMLDTILDAPPRLEFKADGILRQAKADGKIQSSDIAAQLLYRIAPGLLSVESGTHQDVRELPFDTSP